MIWFESDATKTRLKRAFKADAARKIQKTRPDEYRRIMNKTTELPLFSADDILQVYHLRTKPLPIIRTSVGNFNAQTSGLAFRDEHSDQIIVLEFLPR